MSGPSLREEQLASLRANADREADGAGPIDGVATAAASAADDAWEAAPWEGPAPSSSAPRFVSGEHPRVRLSESPPSQAAAIDPRAALARAEAALVAARNEITLLRARVERLTEDNDQLRAAANAERARAARGNRG